MTPQRATLRDPIGALVGLSSNILAPRCILYMPGKERLAAQVVAVLKNWHGGLRARA